jgi:hypothetical protein
VFNFFCRGQFFAQEARNFRGTNLSLLLIFKFLSATEIDEICRGDGIYSVSKAQRGLDILIFNIG